MGGCKSKSNPMAPSKTHSVLEYNGQTYSAGDSCIIYNLLNNRWEDAKVDEVREDQNSMLIKTCKGYYEKVYDLTKQGDGLHYESDTYKEATNVKRWKYQLKELKKARYVTLRDVHDDVRLAMVKSVNDHYCKDGITLTVHALDADGSFRELKPNMEYVDEIIEPEVAHKMLCKRLKHGRHILVNNSEVNNIFAMVKYSEFKSGVGTVLTVEALDKYGVIGKWETTFADVTKIIYEVKEEQVYKEIKRKMLDIQLKKLMLKINEKYGLKKEHAEEEKLKKTIAEGDMFLNMTLKEFNKWVAEQYNNSNSAEIEAQPENQTGNKLRRRLVANRLQANEIAGSA